MLKRESRKINDSVDQNLRLTDSVVLGEERAAHYVASELGRKIEKETT
jgi:hypothetical protein